MRALTDGRSVPRRHRRRYDVKFFFRFPSEIRTRLGQWVIRFSSSHYSVPSRFNTEHNVCNVLVFSYTCYPYYPCHNNNILNVVVHLINDFPTIIKIQHKRLRFFNRTKRHSSLSA